MSRAPLRPQVPLLHVSAAGQVAVALGFTALTALAVSLLRSISPADYQFLFVFVPAVGLSAYAAGRGAGIMAALLATGADALFFVGPTRLALADPECQVGLASFTLVVLGTALATSRLRDLQAAQRAMLDREHAAREEAERARRSAERAADLTARLQTITAEFSRAATPAQVGDVLLRAGASALGAGRVVLGLITEDGAALDLEAAGHPDDVARLDPRASLDHPSPMTDPARTGEPVWIRAKDDYLARYPHLAAAQKETGTEAIAALPLRAEGRVIGAVAITFLEAQPFADADRAFMQALADHGAQALDRARLFEAERRARARIARLQETTVALSRAVSPADVTRVLFEEGRLALGADAVGLALLGDHDAMLNVTTAGYPDAVAHMYDPMPVSAPLPGAEVVRSGEAVWIENRDDYLTRYPHLAGVQGHTGSTAFGCVPLRVEGHVIGSLGFSFRERVRFSADDRAFVQGLADQAAQALERARLYEAERQAREGAEAARLRLDFLVGASAELADILDTDAALAAIARMAVPALADLCTVDLVLPDGTGRRRMVHRDPAMAATVEALERRYPPDPAAEQHPISRVLRTGESILMPRITDDDLAAAARDPDHLDLLRRLGLDSGMTVPLVVHGQTLGALTFNVAGSGRRYAEADLALAEDLARRAALAVERARRFEHERSIAETLQRSLLPERLPEIPGVAIAARYLPGAAGIDVGGDWYDVFEMPDGRLGVVVGDVVGRGVEAAAAMGQVRNALRAFAFDGHAPAAVLARLNRLAKDAGRDLIATLVYAVYDPETGTLDYGGAGHPPPLVRDPGGAAAFLDVARALPLGAARDAAYAGERVLLPPGSTLVLYTDGLVERRGESIDAGLEALRRAVAEGPARADALGEHLIETMVGRARTRDDVAVLVLSPGRLGPSLRLRLPAAPESLRSIRRALRRWLREAGADTDQTFVALVAAGEAATNAIEHAYGPDAAAFDLCAEADAGTVTITVRDSGRWRTARGANRGRGLGLMRSLMDTVDVTQGPQGTTVRMQLRLSRAVIA